MTKITLEDAVLTNFKKHTFLNVQFGETTNLRGKNGEGKSTVGQAVTFGFLGTDEWGSKQSFLPNEPMNDMNTEVEINFIADGNKFNLKRVQTAKDTKVFVNDVPTKVTDFDKSLEANFRLTKDLFLSLFNPSYFFSLHWKKQRELFLRDESAIDRDHVYMNMKESNANILRKQFEKYGYIEDILEASKTRLKKTEAEYQKQSGKFEALSGMTTGGCTEEERKTLTEHIEKLENKKKAHDVLDKQRIELLKAVNSLSHDRERLANSLDKQRDLVRELRSKEFDKECITCGSELPKEKVDELVVEQSQIVKIEIEKGKSMKQSYDMLENELNQGIAKLDSLTARIFPLTQREEESLIDMKVKLREGVNNDVEGQKESVRVELAVLRNKKIDDTDIKEASESFIELESELLGMKVNSQLDKVQVMLFEEVKTTGEQKATFDVVYDGKRYGQLSLGEKIKAGIEVINALSEMNNVELPVFIDNAESISGGKIHKGQAIVCNVTENTLETVGGN